MSKNVSITCNQCQKTVTLAEARGWHKAHTLSHGWYKEGSLVLGSFHPSESTFDIDLCSESCVMVYVSAFIGHLTSAQHPQPLYVEPVRKDPPPIPDEEDTPF